MKRIKIIVLIVLSLILISILTTVTINKILESHYEHEAKLQYGLICKTVDENSEYYTDFSKEFIRVVKTKADVENIEYRHTYQFYETEDEMGIPLNRKLISDWKAVSCEPINGENVWYVTITSLYHVIEFEYWFGYSHTYLVEYFIIYIPDEYINDTNLKAILDDNYPTLLYRKDNLYVVGRSANRA
jgi:hypothetical protein